MQVLITGSREFSDEALMRSVFLRLRREFGHFSVLVGDARGADSIAFNLCHEFFVPCRVFVARWDQFGKRAGLVRNESMVRSLSSHAVCCAFFVPGVRCSGTSHCSSAAARSGVSVRYFTQPDPNQLSLF